MSFNFCPHFVAKYEIWHLEYVGWQLRVSLIIFLSVWIGTM